MSCFSYGSIYYASDGLKNCVKAELVGNVSEALKKDVETRFVIGPITERWWWKSERAEMDIDRGSCM